MADEAAKHRAVMERFKAAHVQELAAKGAQIAKAETVAGALGRTIVLLQRDDEKHSYPGQDSFTTNS